jgi:hypothetical protein
MRLAKIALIAANILWSEAEEIVAYSRISSIYSKINSYDDGILKSDSNE